MLETVTFESNILKDDLYYGFQDVDTKILYSYIESLFTLLKQKTSIKIEEPFLNTKYICEQILNLYMNDEQINASLTGKRETFLRELHFLYI